jgi:hypothetical protein
VGIVAIESLETRLLAGLIVGGADVKYHVAGRVKQGDFTEAHNGAIYCLIMSIPPMTDERSRRRLLDEMADYIWHYTENDDDARTWARHRISRLIDACDTTDGEELAQIADTLRRWSVARAIGLRDGLYMLLAGEELTYAQIRREMAEDGWTKAQVDAALRRERGRGLRARVEAGKSKWSEEARKEGANAHD